MWPLLLRGTQLALWQTRQGRLAGGAIDFVMGAADSVKDVAQDVAKEVGSVISGCVLGNADDG